MTENYQQYAVTIDAILNVSKLEEMTTRKLRKAIESLYDVQFNDKAKKKQIDTLIIDRYNIIATSGQQPNGGVADLQNRLLELQKENSVLAAQLNQSLKSNGVAPKKRKRTVDPEVADERKAKMKREMTGFYKPVKLMPQLAQFLGMQYSSRPEITGALWKYIKANELQNPNDKREILCDDAMASVFGKKVSSFGMAKVVSKFIGPVTDEELAMLRQQRGLDENGHTIDAGAAAGGAVVDGSGNGNGNGAAYEDEEVSEED
ncbi:unnamed protein product [Ambrosiozyma monospora]|uniref:Unnamed protein product n=1 Tax=Ambrosiozyma monospora TaxID=43982 RepID=A0ACB5TC15_AMBMO|nr:unnamed protein product [Ambrosiozyma monospora]